MVEKSLLSYISRRYTFPDIGEVYEVRVITRAPPDLPRPFEVMAMRIFLMPGVSSSPCSGFFSRLSIRRRRSFFKDLWRLARALADLSKRLVVSISKFIEEAAGRFWFEFTCLYVFNLTQGFTYSRSR